jgi:hypothetical protein
MKYINLKVKLILFIMAVVCSCSKPRIELDLGQWGDHAYLDNVQLFKLNVDDSAHLADWYMYGNSVTGVRQVIISQGAAVIDSSNFTATVKLMAGNSLDKAGLLFYFLGTRIEPLSGSPAAGIITDLKGGAFTYRVYSADGSHHDWNVNIEQ